MRYVKPGMYLALALLGIAAAGCTTSETVGPNSEARRNVLQDRAHAALEQILATDTHLQSVLNNAYAYAVLPDVGQGAVGVGAAGGQGVVYQHGNMIGTVTLNQLSLGAQVGGESYSELVVWQDEPAFRRFQKGDLEWGSQATAQILKAGSIAADRFDQGVSVYLLPRSGFEIGASLNGQKLHFHPSDNATSNANYSESSYNNNSNTNGSNSNASNGGNNNR